MRGIKVDCKMGDVYCGICCVNTEMPLTLEDIARIRKLGFKTSSFVIMKDGIPRVRNVHGKCVFLDRSNNRCVIYQQRPEGCRFYPLVLMNNIVTVDQLCPKARQVKRRISRDQKAKLMGLIRRLEEEYLVRIR
ncbi:MAG: YkgJ family cysteine cluster protein [Thermoprotei archaeon]|nr:MAG: YkgJ family cysteine cluster protein [Thermoprotei archaeon]RLF25760.1 MAG: YkgJ family cysteine cluster protein [Thermoprotei archaeon]